MSFPGLIAASALAHGLAGAVVAGLGQPAPEPVAVSRTSLVLSLGSAGAASGGEASPATQPQEVPPPAPAAPAPRPAPVPPPPVPRPEAPAAEPATQSPEPLNPDRAEAPPAALAHAGNAGQSGSGLRSATDTGGETEIAGYRQLTESYDARVLSHLAAHKSFPADARMRHEEGDVAVEFELDRQGGLLRAAILTSSGSRRLDRAALSQIRMAAPFPRPPKTASWTSRVYRTEMRYHLK